MNTIKQEIINTIEEKKLIAIVRGVPEEKLIKLAEALFNGGIRLIEVTFSLNKSVSDEDTGKMIKTLAGNFKGRMYIGAGTVMTKEQVKITKKNGGQFIISPNTDKKVIKASHRLNMVSMPGALTPSEAVSATGWGADFVKLFPATNLGPSYIKAISAPLSNIKFLAVGGIDENNMKDYLKAGAVGFGIGTNIVSKKLLDENNFDAITELAKKYVDAIKEGVK